MVNDRVIFVLALCLCTNCKLALCYQAAWKITVCYGAICKIVVSYHAIYKTVLSYFTFSNIFTTYLLSLQCFMDQRGKRDVWQKEGFGETMKWNITSNSEREINWQLSLLHSVFECRGKFQVLGFGHYKYIQ